MGFEALAQWGQGFGEQFGEAIEMTKEKARLRAKAKAGQKAKKREANAAQPEHGVRPGQFDPGASAIKSPRGNAAATFGGARRGAARSR
jgi:hypothetical protein